MQKRNKLDCYKIIENIIFDTDDCILYKYKNANGYGDLQYYNENGDKRHILAHRCSFEIYNNCTIELEKIIMHKCDVRNCINPKHLSIGTHLENVIDKVNKNRQAKGVKNGRYKNGYFSKYEKVNKPEKPFEKKYNRLLTEEQVKKIKKHIYNGEKICNISRIMNVKYQIVLDIKIGKSYTSIFP